MEKKMSNITIQEHTEKSREGGGRDRKSVEKEAHQILHIKDPSWILGIQYLACWQGVSGITKTYLSKSCNHYTVTISTV